MGRIFDIQRNSTVDGPGIRTTVFFKGCNLGCAWCHNPEGQNFEIQTLSGTVYGRDVTPEEILSEAEKDKAFHLASGGGVTFSGGECMLQPEFLRDCLKLLRQRGISTAVDTAGRVPWESFEAVMPHTDCFLYDVKCMDDSLHRAYTGVSNRLILENLEKLSARFEGEIIIRIPLIGGVNDNDGEMKKIAAFLNSIRHTKAELLPYHGMGEHKYSALGRTVPRFSVPDPQKTAEWKEFFK